VRATPLPVLLALVLLAGCGDDSSGSGNAPGTEARPSLTAGERAQAERSVAAIRGYCRRVAGYAARVAPPPGPEATDRAVQGARRIAALAREKPAARYRPGQTARDLAGDLAEDLEGTNCSARLVSELALGVR
jgi:hypothetical protein